MSQTVREAAHARRDDYLKLLQGLVDFESPTHDRNSVDRLSIHLESLLKSMGWEVERHVQQDVGDHLLARLDSLGDCGTLILAHYDTVWPVGTLREMPFRIEGERAYGPGILDMKGGIGVAISAVELARQLGLTLRGPLTMLLTSDEENGSLTSRHLIEQVCQGQERVLVVEPGNADGGLKSSRKAIGDFMVRFKGISAHAGNNPQDGASALRELAHFLFFAEGLNDTDKGTSINVTVARGGTVSNVIAETAEAEVDLRTLTMEESVRVVSQITSYQPQDKRVQVHIEGGINRPPMEFTAANKALFDEAVAIGAVMGISISGALAGGGSDGNFTSTLGIPTLDGLGAVGFGPHMRQEHIEIPATLDRIALLACLLTTK